MADKKFSEWVSSLISATNEEVSAGYLPVDVGATTKKFNPFAWLTSVIPNDIPLARETSGTNETTVASFLLKAGVYTEFSATLGTNNETNIANLDVREADGAVLKTLSKTGVVGLSSTTGFTLLADTTVFLVLYGSSVSTISYVFSASIK